MSSRSANYLLCYDICNSKRLRRVHRLVRDWGVPVQLSIFEVELSHCQLEQLMAELNGLINQDEDKIMLYRLNPDQDRICLGLKVQTEDLVFV